MQPRDTALILCGVYGRRMSKGEKMNRRRALCRIAVLLVAISLMAVIPQQMAAQTKKGIELYNSMEYPEAEKVFREALKADAKNTAANYYYLGLSLVEQKKNSEALDIFLLVNKIQDSLDQGARPPVPSKYQIQLAMGRARLGLEQYAEAWTNLESARKENESASDVYVYRGVYYYQQKKNAEAIKELEKAISLDRNNAYAYYYSGLANYELGNGKKAAEDLKTFINMAPNAPEYDKAREVIKLC